MPQAMDPTGVVSLVKAFDVMQEAGWKFGAPFLGALGSFFSGSATVSAMTFGSIEENAAHSLGLDPLTVLAMQSVEGSMGNMICIHKIVGLDQKEGYILKRTIVPLLAYGAIVGVIGGLMA